MWAGPEAAQNHSGRQMTECLTNGFKSPNSPGTVVRHAVAKTFCVTPNAVPATQRIGHCLTLDGPPRLISALFERRRTAMHERTGLPNLTPQTVPAGRRQ